MIDKKILILVVIFLTTTIQTLEAKEIFCNRVQKQQAQFSDIMLLSLHKDVRYLNLAIRSLGNSQPHVEELLVDIVEGKLSDMNFYFDDLTNKEAKDIVCETPNLFPNRKDSCQKQTDSNLCLEIENLISKCSYKN